MSAVCSVRDCQKPAVLSWQRAGTEDDAHAHAAYLTAAQQDQVTYQRRSRQLAIADLHARVDSLDQGVPGVDPGTARQLADQVRAEIDAVRAELEQLVDPQPPAAPEPVTVLVFGCDEHAVSADAAAQLHDAGCGPEACACALPAVPSAEPTAEFPLTC